VPVVTIKGVEIFKTGVHNGDTYKVDDLRSMIAAADKVGFLPPLKLGHMDDADTKKLLKKEGMAAFGWVKNLRVEGQKLLADFTDVPRRLGELIKKGAYKRVSAEIYWNYKRGASTFPRALKAVALLGAEIPAITDLKDVEALYLSTPGEYLSFDGDDNEYRTYFGLDTPPESGITYLRKSKEATNYRIADGTFEQCRTCTFFIGERDIGRVGLCSLVEGGISTDFICDLFELSEAFQSVDGNAAVADGTKENILIDKVGGIGARPGRGTKQIPRVRLNPASRTTIERIRELHCLINNRGIGRDTLLGCFKTQEEAEQYRRDVQGVIRSQTGEDMVKTYKIEKQGDKYCLIAEDGKVLGCHDTREEAVEQEQAVKAQKKKNTDRVDALLDQLRSDKEFASDVAEHPEVVTELQAIFDALDDEEIKLFDNCHDCLETYKHDGNMAALETWFQKVGFEKCLQQLPAKTKNANIDGKRVCNFLKTRLARKGVSDTKPDGAKDNVGMEKIVKELQGQLDLKKQEITDLRKAIEKLQEGHLQLSQLTEQLNTTKVELETLKVARRDEGITNFIAQMKREGKVLPKDEEKTFALLKSADESKTISFTENGKEEKLSQREMIEKSITDTKPQVSFGEYSKGLGGDGVRFLTGNVQDQITSLVTKYRSDHPEVTVEAATRTVLDANPKLKEEYAKSF